MNDLDTIEKIFNNSKIPFIKNMTSEILARYTRSVWWITVIEPSGYIIDFKFDEKGKLESIASELTQP